MFRNIDAGMLYPADREKVSELTKRWRITDEQLTEAILETGSIELKVLREHMIRKGVIFSLFYFLKGQK